jgi:hypothetical protein
MQPLIVGIAVFAFSVVVQTTAAAAGVALLETMIRRGHAQGTFSNIAIILQLMVFILLGAHLVQMAGWAIVFVWCGQFADFGAAFYHSAVNYTTLGYGDVVMARPWRLLGPIEAMDGMLMAGVSAAILFAVLHRLVDCRLAEAGAGNRPIRAEPRRARLGNVRVNDAPGHQGLDGRHA